MRLEDILINILGVNVNLESIITIACGIITAIAMVLLAIITIYYARQTRNLVKEAKIARRDDPNLKVYIHDPPDYEWEQMNVPAVPIEKYVRFKAILVNPGLVPIVIKDISEEILDKDGNVLSTVGNLAIPLEAQPHRLGIYIYGITWVIMSDDFAIWCRTFDVSSNEATEYLSKVKFIYEVGENTKEEDAVIELGIHKTDN